MRLPAASAAKFGQGKVRRGSAGAQSAVQSESVVWTGDPLQPHSVAESSGVRIQKREAFVYIFVTVVLALLIAGFGAGVALGLRMPEDGEE